MELGKLTEVNVRDLWKHEQYDFSNWLAKPENIELLNDILGLTLVNVQKEVFVGSYRCDLVAEDETSGIKVVIENQLEASNHEHLGKVITYASGLDADVVVWIVTDAREEHISAVEWLNQHLDKNINVFFLELHAYKIGDSLAAPKFEIVGKPNDFIKSTRNSGGTDELSQTRSNRLEFWTEFNDVIAQRGKPFNIRKATTDHWYDVAIGTSACHLSITLVNKESFVGVELYINDNKSLFDALAVQKESIEEDLSFPLEWQRLDHKKASRILYRIPGLNFDDHSNYGELMNMAIDIVIKMRKVFQDHIPSEYGGHKK